MIWETIKIVKNRRRGGVVGKFKVEEIIDAKLKRVRKSGL